MKKLMVLAFAGFGLTKARSCDCNCDCGVSGIGELGGLGGIGGEFGGRLSGIDDKHISQLKTQILNNALNNIGGLDLGFSGIPQNAYGNIDISLSYGNKDSYGKIDNSVIPPNNWGNCVQKSPTVVTPVNPPIVTSGNTDYKSISNLISGNIGIGCGSTVSTVVGGNIGGNTGVSGTQYVIRSPYGKVLDISQTKPTDAIIYEFHGGVNQRFTITRDGPHSIIRCVQDNGVLEAGSNEQVDTRPFNNTPNEKWTIKKVSGKNNHYMIINVSDGKCLDLKQSINKNDNDVINHPCHGLPNQLWQIIPITPGSTIIPTSYTPYCP